MPTLYIKEKILQEEELKAQFRSAFQIDNLVILAEVDISKFPNYEEASYVTVKQTPQQIYQAMSEKNPALIDLVKSIGFSPAKD